MQWLKDLHATFYLFMSPVESIHSKYFVLFWPVFIPRASCCGLNLIWCVDGESNSEESGIIML